MSTQELLSYCEQHKLPQPLIEFLKQPTEHLILFGGQKCMYNERITDEKLVDICQVLKQLNFQRLLLDLGCNELTDNSIQTLQDLFKTKLITGISLRQNKFTSNCCELLSQIIQQSQLIYISLSGNPLNEGSEKITQAIYESPAMHYGIINQDYQPHGTLQYLDLEDTGFCEKANIYLSKFLQSRFCGLRELKLRSTQFNINQVSINGFYRLINAIKYNTTLEALTIVNCDTFDDTHAVSLIQALTATVAVHDAFNEQSSDQKVQERIDTIVKLQQRNLQQKNYPRPIEKNQAVTPLKYLDLSANNISFDICLEIAKYLQVDNCYLKTIILNGIKIKNQGVNALSEQLLKYQLKDFNNEQLVTCSGESTINERYELFGFYNADDGYDQKFKNITLQNFDPNLKVSQISLSFQRSQIEGQGLSTLAILCKLNKQIQYLSLQGNSLNIEYGTTSNEKTVWHPMLEWETAFEIRSQTGNVICTDFGLERSELEKGRLLFYKKPQHVLKAISVFE